MLESNTIQIINAIANVLGLICIIATYLVIYSYKKRTAKRYEHIDKQLDDIIKHSHEVRENVKEIHLDQKKNKDAAISRETSSERTSGS